MNASAVRLISWVTLLAAVAGGLPAAHGAKPKSAQTATNSPFVLGRVPPQEPPPPDLEALSRKWDYFQHEPFDKTGFNQVMLPFHYTSNAPGGSPHDAYAFSFLLGNALDWAPGCYCTKHAYYLFKKSRKEMRQAADSYKPALIRKLIEQWDGTHAVGGELRRQADGFSGRLLVFDARGGTLLDRNYEKSRDYFDLVGDMAVDALRFFGHEPSPELDALVRRPRCTQFQSIRDLGAAAFAELRSEQESSFYERILERDPEFAEVRYWYALQHYWKTYDRQRYREQKFRALQSYPVEAALADIDGPEWSHPTQGPQYDQWLTQAERLMGRNAPALVDTRLYGVMQTGGALNRDLLVAALQAAGAHPNDGDLLMHLARCLSGDAANVPNCPSDAALAASLALATFQNRFQFNVFGNTAATRSFARAANELGYSREGAALAWQALVQDQERGASDAWLDALILAAALSATHRYADAVPLLLLWHDGRGEAGNGYPVVFAAVNAVLAGRYEVLTKIEEHYGKAGFGQRWRPVFNAWRRVATNEIRTLKELRYRCSVSPESPQPWESYWDYPFGLILSAELDLRDGTFECRQPLKAYLQRRPIQRWLWVLYDAYDSRAPNPETADFYRMLEWLYGDDPWVKQAVAGFKRRTPNAPKTDAEKTCAAFTNYPAMPWPIVSATLPPDADRAVFRRLPPGAVAAAVRVLVEQKQFDRAEDLVLRALTAATALNEYSLRAHCNHLYHITQAARRAPATAPAKPSSRRL